MKKADIHWVRVQTLCPHAIAHCLCRAGREVGRHIGSSRADLIGKILQIQQDLGISPPPRPSIGAVPRRKARPVW